MAKIGEQDGIVYVIAETIDGEYFDVARVKTVWANMNYDNHKTIDKSKYVQEIA